MSEHRRQGEMRLNRREVLTGVAAVSAFAAVDAQFVGAATKPERSLGDRLSSACAVRRRAADSLRALGVDGSTANGDELRCAGFSASYSKGLLHNTLGEVDERSYRLLLAALRSGRGADFEAIPLGGQTKLANPQAALMFDLVGPDSSQVPLAPPPCMDSAEQGAELVELYWQALARDIPFADYDASVDIGAGCAELSRWAELKGPRVGAGIDPAHLFRGTTAGDLVGPYVSQFLWRDIPFTPMKIPQRIRTAVGARDFLTHERDWLSVQNGALTGINEFDPAPRYIRNGRDLGEYVHRDFTYQAFLSACLMLNKLGVPLDGSNPYKHSYTQSGFSTFGAPYLLHLVAVVANVALRASWYQKWLVHRRLRPEELAGRVQVQRAGKATYPLHRSLLDAPVLDRVASHSGSHLLSQAYPEGSPTHPSYPAGHAIIAGACVTVMKAFFDESFVIPSPVVAARDGLSLLPWKGSELTVGGELDKLASNVAIGRNFAGIHWRSDATEGLRAGEWTAIEVLREMRLTGNEMFSGFSLRRFDGQRITI